jgi:hypothetical protein
MQIFRTIILHVIDFTSEIDFSPGTIMLMATDPIRSPNYFDARRAAPAFHG